jgi:golgin subfamily B member 1
MADFLQYLAILDADPDDSGALAGLVGLGPSSAADPAVAPVLATTRKKVRDRGRPEIAVRLLDVELSAVIDATARNRRADLLLEKAQLLEDELLDEAAAVAALNEVLSLRDDETALEMLEQIEMVRANWKKVVAKYVEEARAATDRQLATQLYTSAAEIHARVEPDADEVERLLRKALEVDPKNRKPAAHLERLLRSQARWTDLARHLEERAEVAGGRDERAAALLGLAELSRTRLKDEAAAIELIKKVVAIDPGQPQAIKILGDVYQAAENWPALVQLYTAALKARRGADREELAMLLQVGMILWRRLGDLDLAEEYFRRIRKVEPAHLAALDFYRAYYPPRGEGPKLLQMLRQAEKALPSPADPRARALALEIAELAEAQLGNPEKAIDAWKQLLRQDPGSGAARDALKRLYRRTEKWNALLDMMKEEIERLPDTDVRGRVARLGDMVEIYRTKLRLDPMVINTLSTILKIDPDNRAAMDELADKYRQLGKWNDLIGVLGRKAEIEALPVFDRVGLLREIADLWIDRFGNHAQAIRPLERILELYPGDADTIARLKDIYTRRRQWRQLITLLGREADALAQGDAHGPQRLAKMTEMARLASERVGDNRLAIELHNAVLAAIPASSDAPELGDTLAALASLYERDKRWLALAEILRRQRDRAATSAEAVGLLEKLGTLLSDRVGAPRQAADVFAEILTLDPSHARSLRTLRELYAHAGDYDALERLYGSLGQWDELIDALGGIADRVEDRAVRLAVLERAAAVAEARPSAPAAPAAPRTGGRTRRESHAAIDRVARTWERVLSVDPHHVGAARALAPIYARQEKWARLLPVLEVQLAAAPDAATRLARMLEIRELCEHKLGSRSLAFAWTARAFELEATDPAIEADLLRLAHEPEQWREVASLFDRIVAEPHLPEPARLRLLRTAARVAATRVAEPERARGYERRVLDLVPDDVDAVGHLEELAIQLSDWPALVASIARRAELAGDPATRLELRLRVAQLQEERLADLDAAVDTYEAILADQFGPAAAARALAALARLHEARGDWDDLDAVLARQLAATDAETPEGQIARAALLMRLGGLEERSLDKPALALDRYLEAVALASASGAQPPAIGAAERYLDTTPSGLGHAIPPERRVAVAHALLPHLERAGDPARLARALETVREAREVAAPLALDRRLLALYDVQLGDAPRAWDAAVRVLAGDPSDLGVRATLDRLAAHLGRDAELARHLSGALAARRQAGAPPSELRVLAAELASVHGDRLGDEAAAENDWLAVIEADPADGAAAEVVAAYDALARMYRAAERWADLRALLERRSDASPDDAVRKAALLELAELEDSVLADPARAIASLRRVLDLDPAHLDSYKKLERLYADHQRWAELEELLGRELDHVADKDQIDLQHRRADLRARRLGDLDGAIDLLEEVVGRRRGHADARELLEELSAEPAAARLRLRIAQILEPLYEADELWKDLVGVLRIQHADAAGADAVELLVRIATTEEDRLGSPRAAFDTWCAAMIADPADARARTALPRLAMLLDRWPDAAACWEQAIHAGSHDVALQVELLSELGTFYDVRIGAPDQAVGAYQRLAEADPTNPDVVRRACGALARLHEERERWGDLRDVLRRLADWAETPHDKKALLGRVATLEEDKLSRGDAALATWRDLLAEDPEDARALDALERLYVTGGQWSELVDILRRRIELAADREDRKQLLRRIAEIHEHRLHRPGEAIAAHLEILEHIADDVQTLGELTRLYRAADRHADLLDTLERRLAVAEAHGEGGAIPVELRFEIGQLLAGPLAREREALERWAEVLIRQPDHPGALTAVEEALDDDELREPAAAVLRPLYEAVGQDDKLAALLDRLAAGADDVRDRLGHLREVAQIRERRLGDRQAAFAAAVRALEVAVAEPELAGVLGEVDRLASETGREAELIDIYRRVAPDVLDGEIQRRMYLDVADLARGVSGDIALAREHYQKVLDAQPDDRRSLLALEGIHRETHEHARLWEILTRKAELATSDPDEKVGALAEAAALCAGPLGRHDEAIVEWEQVLELAPERKDAVAALETLYRDSRRWHDLVDLLERRLGFTFTVEEAVELRLRLGEIHERELHDGEAAIDSYAAALGGDPSNAAAVAALERFLDDPVARSSAAEVLQPLYVSRQQWSKLVRIYEIKLDAAAEPAERLRVTRYIARLYEEQLEDLEGAARWYARLFRENTVDPGTRDQLQRLAQILDNWKFLAEVYQEWLDDEAGESPTVRDVAVVLATIYDRRLDDVDRGQAAYRRALGCDVPGSVPDDREVFARLEALLTRAGRWTLLVEVYEEAVAAEDEVRRRAELLARMAAVLEEKITDRPRAIDAWREVMTQTADDAALGVAWSAAAGELDRLYRAETQWYDLAELIGARIDRIPQGTGGDGRRAELRLSLADVLEHQLRDVPGAIDQYEAILAGAVDWDKALPQLERLVVLDDHRERIADLLEPVYRKWDWWQKLVVILDAKLAYVDDPARKVEMLREIATIHDTRGGDLSLAFDALARAWKIEPADVSVFDALTNQAARLGAWDELVDVLESGIAGSFDPDVAAAVHARIAEIHETQRGDHPAAIASWRRVLDQRTDDPSALGALDRLLAVEGRADELVAVVERRADLADDGGIRLVLLHRVASLYEEVLDRPSDAIAAYRNVLSVDDADEAALDALDRLYRHVGDHQELAAVLARKIELARGPDDRRGLRLAAARVHERDLNDVFEAVSQLQAILAETPTDGEALAELDRLHLRERSWPELLEVVDRRAALADTPEVRADLAFRAARLVEKELLEPADAITRYGEILQLAPSHGDARGALEAMIGIDSGARAGIGDDHVDAAGAVLEELYRKIGDAEALVTLYERRLMIPGDPDARRAQWAALAEIHETLRDDLAVATRTWARALAEAPDELSLLGPLERLAGVRGAWPELAAILDERLGAMTDPDLEHAYATRLGQIHEEAIGDPAAAVTAYRRALAVAGDERPSLAALDRVLLRAGRHAELTEILVREADAAPDDAAAADFLFRLGDVRETALGDVGEAIAAYREALSRAPQHRAARGSLERLLVTADDHRAAIIEVLEPIYEDDADWPRLVELLAAKLSVTEDRRDRAAIFQRIAELSEQRLRDPVRALDAAGGWLVEDPSSAEALAEVERLAASLGRWGEVGARLSGIVGGADLDPEVRLQLLLRLGAVQLDRIGDVAGATATLQAALDIDDESAAALESLERIYRGIGDQRSLAAVLVRRGELAYEPTAKRGAFAEVADLRERMGDVDGAVAAWRRVLELDEADREAQARLAALYERAGDHRALVEILEQSARYARDPADEKALRVRIAELENGLAGSSDGSVDRAVAAWQAVLDVDPDDGAALGHLEALHTRAEDWLAVQEVLSRQLDLARGSADRVAVMTAMARLAEERRGSIEDAIATWYSVLEVDNAHVPAYDELERLLAAAERWHDLVELLAERRADVEGTLGRTEAEIQALARAADIWEGPLDNPDAAGEILEKILRREPGSVSALTRLARIYERASDWDRCSEVLQKALALGPRGRDAADLFYRLGEVARNASGDLDTAWAHWRQALTHDPAHAPTIAALEKVARDRQDWATLADLLTRREASATKPADRLALGLELAEVYQRLDRPGDAIPVLARAAEAAPGDVRVLGPLADLYFAAGRLDEAAPIYDRLAEEAKAARRMKDVARFRQRQGGILEARGDAAGALAAYEEAFRVNPSDIPTLAGLGRLYLAHKDWDKARKVYSSLMLQNFHADVGLTKAEVYLALGVIFIELGQVPKAKGMFQRGLEIEPGNLKLKEALARMS